MDGYGITHLDEYKRSENKYIDRLCVPTPWRIREAKE